MTVKPQQKSTQTLGTQSDLYLFRQDHLFPLLKLFCRFVASELIGTKTNRAVTIKVPNSCTEVHVFPATFFSLSCVFLSSCYHQNQASGRKQPLETTVAAAISMD